jgi:Fur family transcriptional regulator, ferric uptake regulator
MNTADYLLQAHHLNKTPCRADVINALASSELALSEKDLKERLNFDYDRTTLFRTLRKFLQTGIIHSVAIDGQDIRYAINHNNQHQSEHYHAHFHCGRCHSVVCLEQVSIQQPQIPAGFEAEEFNLVINGKCAACNEPTEQ